MPAGIGYPGGRGSGLAGQALARQGVPANAGLPGGAAAPDSETIAEVLQMLKGGQVGAEKLMQLLATLAASTTGQMQGGGARQERPRRQGRDRPAGVQQTARAAPDSIRGLLG